MMVKAYTLGKFFVATLRGRIYLLGVGWKDFYIFHLSAPPWIVKLDLIWYVPDQVLVSGMILGKRFNKGFGGQGDESSSVGTCNCNRHRALRSRGGGGSQGMSRTRKTRVPDSYLHFGIRDSHPHDDTPSDLRDTSGKVQL